tara:strand:+ start:3007 stop:3450 length:444 start_codon:yes stop_codon:yes gene_type:complete
MRNHRLICASDHAGYNLKKELLNYFKTSKNEIYDLGTYDDKSVDYPDFAHKLCKRIQNDEGLKGILICGTGIGMSIVANRYKKVRAALCLDEKMSKLSREHNNANVIVLGSRLISINKAIKCISCFIGTQFEAGRHTNRIAKINTKL